MTQFPESKLTEEALFRLGNIYESVYVQQFYKAIETYNKLVQLNKNTNFDVYFRGAQVYEGIGDLQNALAWYTEAASKSNSSTNRTFAKNKAARLQMKPHFF